MLTLPNRLLVLTAIPLSIALVACGTSGADGNASGPTAGAGAAGATGATGAGGDLFTSAGSMGTSTNSGPGDCDPALTGVVRDFRAYDNGAGHPDFETFTGDGLKGIVEDMLGPDHKPVYAHPGGTSHTTGPAEFAQWYRDTDGVNMAMQHTIVPTVDPNGVATYDNSFFFPIDDQGYGNEGREHNFHFTFELHMTFTYKGGEIFSFTGDDDLFVFVNDRLAIDLGGLHPAQSDVLDLDARAAELGIVPGQVYPLDFFQAERHTDESNFKIQSTLDFENCDVIVY